MVLRKITIDNGVRYIPITEKKQKKEIKPKTIKTCSLSRNQNKNLSQTKFIKNVAAGGFATRNK